MVTKEQKEIVLENLRNGLPTDQSCANAGVSRRSHYFLIKRYPDYKKKVAQAKVYLATIAAGDLRRKIEDGRATVAEDMAVLKVKSKAEWADTDKSGEGAHQIIIQTYGPTDPLQKALKKDTLKKDKEANKQVNKEVKEKTTHTTQRQS